jgi:hypothetical protein
MLKKIYVVLAAVVLISVASAGTKTNHKISVTINPESHTLTATIRLR